MRETRLERNFTSIPLQKSTIVLAGDVVNHLHDSSNACLHVVLSNKACKLSRKEAGLHANDGGFPAFLSHSLAMVTEIWFSAVLAVRYAMQVPYKLPVGLLVADKWRRRGEVLEAASSDENHLLWSRNPTKY